MATEPDPLMFDGVHPTGEKPSRNVALCYELLRHLLTTFTSKLNHIHNHNLYLSYKFLQIIDKVLFHGLKPSHIHKYLNT